MHAINKLAVLREITGHARIHAGRLHAFASEQTWNHAMTRAMAALVHRVVQAGRQKAHVVRLPAGGLPTLPGRWPEVCTQCPAAVFVAFAHSYTSGDSICRSTR